MANEPSPSQQQNLDRSYIINDDWIFPIKYETNLGEPIDITGFTGELEICFGGTKITDSPFSLDLSSPKLDETQGQGLFKVPRATTATLSAGTYSYNIVLIDVYLTRQTLRHGYFKAEKLC